MSKKRSSARRALPPAPSTDAPAKAEIIPANESPISPTQGDLDPSRHTRKCAICHHPDRDSIEDDFIHWVRPYTILSEYSIRDHKTLYRHARALGLDFLRRRNLRLTLEPILEAAQHVRITADSVISAARVYSHINEDGQWIDPPRESIITKKTVLLSQHSSATQRALPSHRRRRAQIKPKTSNLETPKSNRPT